MNTLKSLFSRLILLALIGFSFFFSACKKVEMEEIPLNRTCTLETELKHVFAKDKRATIVFKNNPTGPLNAYYLENHKIPSVSKSIRVCNFPFDIIKMKTNERIKVEVSGEIAPDLGTYNVHEIKLSSFKLIK